MKNSNPQADEAPHPLFAEVNLPALISRIRTIPGMALHTLHNDSSAFEHVFVGEKKGSEVSGFHNWIQFLRLESSGVLDYQGYFAKQCGDPPRIVTLAFRMKDGSTKPRGSMFLGTSPEFEMALYTVIFLSGHNHVNVRLDSCKAVVTCHPIHGGSYI
ncbi:hypothetical protein X801_04575, partial [Opisthorchis viverrini]